MLTHIVFFKLKEDKKDRGTELLEALLGMNGKIEPLKHIEAGMDVIHSDRSYDVGLLTRFDSVEDLRSYQVHPVHVAVLNLVKELAERTVTMDYIS